MAMNSDSLATTGSPPRWQRERRWLLMALAVWLTMALGLRPLMLPDEGRYAEVAREMLLGDAWVPTLLGLPFFHKPPLMYWLDALALQVFGVNAFAARFAPAVGGWLMGAALYLDLHQRAGPREAALALGVLATTPFFFFGSQYANHDMLVAGLITVAVLCLQRAVEQPRPAWPGWLLGAWCAMGLAVLAKGLIGLVLPGLIIVPWLFWRRPWRDANRSMMRLLHPLGWLAFSVIVLPWFVAMQVRFPEFLDYFFVEQHFRRFLQAGFNNAEPVWFFVAVVPLLTLPWSLWLPTVVRERWRSAAPPVHADASGVPGRDTGLLVWWVIAVLGFFSMPSSKLVGYALPALAPLVALLAVHLQGRRFVLWVMPAAACLCWFALAGLVWSSPDSHRDIGTALGAEVKAGDRVVLVDAPYFDVPFYARLAQPPHVLADWDDPAIAHSDGWLKELKDAARFAAPAASRRLISERELLRLLCTPGRVWLVAPKGWRPPALIGELTQVHQGQHGELLRATGGARAGCD